MKGLSRVLARALVVLLALATAGAVLAQAGLQASERVALVVGNGSYKTAPLPNPGNDARAMGALLQRAGFAVDQRIDTSQAELQQAIERFGQVIRDPKVKFGLFYYAGHGLQLEWRNYLVPVSAEIRTADDVKRQTVDVSQLLAYMDQAKGRSFLVILDACRDDPFGGSYRPSAKGLSQFDAPVGSLLAYATAPGNVALDGEGANGLYTSNLLQEFAVPGARLEDAFKRVRLNVRLASKGRQIPWESTSLEEDVYLFPTQRRKLSDTEQEQQLDQELEAWVRVKSTNNVEQLAGFLRQHPSGYVSELAQARLSRLMAQQTVQQAQADAARRAAEQSQRLAEAERVARAEAERQAEAGRLAREEQARRQAEAERLARLQAQAAVQAAAQAAQAAVAERARLDAQREREAAQLARLAEEAADKARQEALQQADAARRAREAETQRLVQAAPIELAPTPYSAGYAEHARQYQVGDVHTFRIVDGMTKAEKPLQLKVTAVDVEGDQVEFNGGEFVSDLMGNTTSNTRGVFSGPRQFYPAELHVGKKWQTMFKQKRPSGITYTFRYDVRVVARERITVPAGTFDAYKIEARGFNVQLGASLTRTIWVAPGVAADIAHETLVRLRNNRIEQYDRQELVSVQAGPR
jgi:hypothetical protein